MWSRAAYYNMAGCSLDILKLEHLPGELLSLQILLFSSVPPPPQSNSGKAYDPITTLFLPFAINDL
jgi:hypothetical protein